MQVTLKTTDGISAALRLALEAARDKRPYLEAMGMAFVSVSKRSFTDAGLRVEPWKAKRDGSASTLQKSTTLRRSVRVVSTDADSVTVGSDRPYAAIHQFGGRTRAHVIEARKGRALAFGGIVRKKVKHPGSKIPARPFLPVTTGGTLSADAAREIREALAGELEARIGFST